jgi:hypothetical protein
MDGITPGHGLKRGERMNENEETRLKGKNAGNGSIDLPIFRLLASILDNSEGSIEIELPKLIIHSSPLEIMVCRDPFELYAKMLGLGDYIIDSLSSKLSDLETARRELGTTLDDAHLKKVVEDYQFWAGYQKRCAPVNYQCEITGAGDDKKLIWESPRSHNEIQCTPATSQVGFEALDRMEYSALICDVREIFNGARRLAFRIGEVSIDDKFHCDARKHRTEDILNRIKEGYDGR